MIRLSENSLKNKLIGYHSRIEKLQNILLKIYVIRKAWKSERFL